MTPRKSKRPRAFGVLHVSPNAPDATTLEAVRLAQRATRLDPRLVYASQSAAPGHETDQNRADVIQIAPMEVARMWGRPDYEAGYSQRSIDEAVAKTLTRIDKSIHSGAPRVLLDEIRGNTAPVAAEVFRQLPKELRGKVAAYIVGGPKVSYENNPTFDDPKLWDAMRGAKAEAVLESYGSPGLNLEKGAEAVKDKLRFLAQRGIAGSPAVGLRDKYVRPQIDGDWAGIRERAAANERAAAWAAAIHRVMPNVPISEWVAGTIKDPATPGRMAAFLRGAGVPNSSAKNLTKPS